MFFSVIAMAMALSAPLETLQIEASCIIQSWPMGSKSFVIQPNGTAHFESQVGKDKSEWKVELTKEQLAELDRITRENNFYSLPWYTGMLVYSTSSRHLTIKRNGIEHEVRIFPVFNDGLKDDKKQAEL